MSKCMNCNARGVYLVETRGANPQVFCEKHLPWFLTKSKDTLKRLDTVEAPKAAEAVEEVKSVKKSKKKEEVVAETPAEPVVSEETVTDEN